MRARFPDRFQHYAMPGQHSQPNSTLLCQRCKRVQVLSATVLFVVVVVVEKRPGSACHCSTTGVERTPNKSQHRKLTLE